MKWLIISQIFSWIIALIFYFNINKIENKYIEIENKYIEIENEYNEYMKYINEMHDEIHKERKDVYERLDKLIINIRWLQKEISKEE